MCVEFVAGVHGLGDAVGIENKRIAGLQGYGALFISGLRIDPKRHMRDFVAYRFDGIFTPMQKRRHMTGVDDRGLVGDGIEHGQYKGDETVFPTAAAEHAV